MRLAGRCDKSSGPFLSPAAMPNSEKGVNGVGGLCGVV